MGLCRDRVTVTSTVAVPLIGIISPLSASKWVQNLLICTAVLPRYCVHKVGWTNTQMEYHASGHDNHQGACIIAECRCWWLLISPLFLFDFLLPEVLPVAAAVSTLSVPSLVSNSVPEEWDEPGSTEPFCQRWLMLPFEVVGKTIHYSSRKAN